MKLYNLIGTTMFGLEPILEKELTELGAQNIEKSNRAVSFTGDLSLIYRANIKLRTALKILKEIKSFNAKNEKELYRQVCQIKWHKILDISNTFSVSSTVYSKYFNHSKYVSLVVKDAIVDHFKKKHDQRPSVDLKNPDFNIHIHISNNKCTLSLNSSGESLHKRGYRASNFKAPLNEVLAAGIVLLSNWVTSKKLIDPMCGSGTLLIEAALIAINRAPNIYRDSFGFQKWKDYDQNLYETIKNEIEKEEVKFDKKIYGFDISASALLMAKQNTENMQLEKYIELDGQDFIKSESQEDAILIFNPPYGKRIQLKPNYYKEIGDTLKQKYINSSAWLISSELDELKKVGLKPSKKIRLYNGPLECKLVNYELYKGSKKISKIQTTNTPSNY